MAASMQFFHGCCNIITDAVGAKFLPYMQSAVTNAELHLPQTGHIQIQYNQIHPMNIVEHNVFFEKCINNN
jgi:hypothetical protein